MRSLKEIGHSWFASLMKATPCPSTSDPQTLKLVPRHPVSNWRRLIVSRSLFWRAKLGRGYEIKCDPENVVNWSNVPQNRPGISV